MIQPNFKFEFVSITSDHNLMYTLYNFGEEAHNIELHCGAYEDCTNDADFEFKKINFAMLFFSKLFLEHRLMILRSMLVIEISAVMIGCSVIALKAAFRILCRDLIGMMCKR